MHIFNIIFYRYIENINHGILLIFEVVCILAWNEYKPHDFKIDVKRPAECGYFRESKVFQDSAIDLFQYPWLQRDGFVNQ